MTARESQIPSAAYLDPAIFAEEQRHLFRGHWQPVAMLADLRSRNDFVVATVGGREVVIQNFGESLRAFTNTCPHRFSAIQTAARGNRVLQCPYHRWTFDSEGLPATIPLRDDFACLDGEPPGSRRLERWHLDICGEMVFVCQASPPAPLRDHLGNLYDWIAAVTRALGHEIEGFETTIAANWKVIMQNTVEFAHVFSVHPETFRPLVDLPLRVMDREATAPHIRYLTAMKASRDFARIDTMLARHFEAPAPVTESGYEHVLAFPALTIGHTNGRAFSFFQYTPLAADRTRLAVRTWLPRAKAPSEATDAFCATLGSQIAGFIRQLSDEDSRICEAVQRGIAGAPEDWRMCFSDGEYLVRRFQSHYLEQMAARLPGHGARP